jgi:mannose-6-phosphate isomerase-like protein (cupin superfamily)
MSELKIVRAADVQPQNLRGQPQEAGQVKRIMASEKLYLNVDEVNPGHSPHRWHRHTQYEAGGQRIEYAPDFEEIYFILSGNGLMQWKTAAGEVREQAVGPGDTIHMPAGVTEHQFLNNGTEPVRLAVVGVPPPRRTPLP